MNKSDDVKTHYVCPDCGSIDMKVAGRGILKADGTSTSTAVCPNCGWSGPLSETHGFVTTEDMFTTERLAGVMLRVVTKHAAGPLVQVLEFAGIIPKMMHKAQVHEGVVWTQDMVDDHDLIAQETRDTVMRKIFEATLTTSFMAAAEQYGKNKDALAAIVKRGELAKPSVFGGDVGPS